MSSSAVPNQPTTFTMPVPSNKHALLVASTPRRIARVMASNWENFPCTPSHNSRHRRQKQPPRSWISNSPPLGVWDQFPTERTVQQMMDTMERMMQDPFAYSGVSFPSLSGGTSDDEEHGISSYRRWQTPWEIDEGDGEYRMRFDMPGMTKEDVKAWVEEKILVVNAEKMPGEDKADHSCTAAEAEEGKAQEEDWAAKTNRRYNSRIVLPDNIDVEKIASEVKDGVLYITIPKAAGLPKMVDIDVK